MPKRRLKLKGQYHDKAAKAMPKKRWRPRIGNHAEDHLIELLDKVYARGETLQETDLRWGRSLI